MTARPPSATPAADLPALIAEVRRLIDAAGDEAGGYDPAAIRSVLTRLMEDHGARISGRWDSVRVRLAGITATSTIDPAVALQNWLGAAARQLPGEGPR